MGERGRGSAHLSSITSLSTFIIAADCSSVKPSSSSRWTNLSVSKWWSRLCAAEAWKDRRSAGGSRRRVFVGGGRAWGVCRHGGAMDIGVPGSCHRRVAPFCCCCWKIMLETPRVVAGDSCVPAQLSRGRRNRGNVCAVFIVYCEGMPVDAGDVACRERFALWGVVTGSGHAASKSDPAPNPHARQTRQLPPHYHPGSSDARCGAATMWECG